MADPKSRVDDLIDFARQVEGGGMTEAPAAPAAPKAPPKGVIAKTAEAVGAGAHKTVEAVMAGGKATAAAIVPPVGSAEADLSVLDRTRQAAFGVLSAAMAPFVGAGSVFNELISGGKWDAAVNWVSDHLNHDEALKPLKRSLNNLLAIPEIALNPQSGWATDPKKREAILNEDFSAERVNNLLPMLAVPAVAKGIKAAKGLRGPGGEVVPKEAPSVELKSPATPVQPSPVVTPPDVASAKIAADKAAFAAAVKNPTPDIINGLPPDATAPSAAEMMNQPIPNELVKGPRELPAQQGPEAVPLPEQPTSPLNATPAAPAGEVLPAPTVSAPALAEPIKAIQPEIPPTEGTEAAGGVRTPPQAVQPPQPDVFQGYEGAGGGPPIQTIPDAHAAVVPAIEAILSPAEARKVASEMVGQMRQQGGFTEQEIRDAYRAKINESGILSKNQQAAAQTVAKTEARVKANWSRVFTDTFKSETGSMQLSGIADLLARKATARMLEPDWGTQDVPSETLSRVFTVAGVRKSMAREMADAAIASLTDETGALKFGKREDQSYPAYDRQAAEPILVKFLKNMRASDLQGELTSAADVAKLNLKTPMTPESVSAARTVSAATTSHMNDVMAKVADGQAIEPGELLHAATVAGAVAEKARNAAIRWGGEKDPSGASRDVPYLGPVRGKDLLDFGERMHNAMSEPELYAQLRSMGPDQQANWLADMWRAGNRGSQNMYMALYMNSLLSNPATLVKATSSHFQALPFSILDRGLAAQLGKLLPSERHVIPGEATQMAITYWDTMKDQMSLMRDWRAMTNQMIDKGEYHPPIMGADTPFENMFNAVAGAPSYALGVQRSAFKVITQQGELRAQAFAKASAERRSGADFWKTVEFYQQNPTPEMMAAADAFAAQQTFTSRLEGVEGQLKKFTNTTAGKILIDPFANVALNIMDYTNQHTPGMNFLSTQWRKDFNEGGRARDLALAKVGIGSAVIGTGYYLGMQGLVTGDGPRDPRALALWRLSGYERNSIYNPISGKWTSHLALGPFSGLLAMGGDGAFITRHADTMSGGAIAAAGVLTLLEPITHAGYLETFANIVDAIKSGTADEKWVRMMRDKIEGLALVKPGIVQAVTNATMDEKPLTTLPRDTFLNREWQALKDDVTSQWPGFAQGFPPQRNFLTYEPTLRDGAWPFAFGNPFKTHEDKPDQVAAEIDRLQTNVGHDKFSMVKPPQYISGQPPQGGIPTTTSLYEGVRLNDWEYDRLLYHLDTQVKLNGDTLHSALEKLIISKQYQAEPDGPEGGKAMMLSRTYHAYLHAAQMALRQEDPALNWMVVQKLVDQKNALLPKGSPPLSNPLGPEPPPTVYPRPGQQGAK
jgi:hypothetical protein